MSHFRFAEIEKFIGINCPNSVKITQINFLLIKEDCLLLFRARFIVLKNLSSMPFSNRNPSARLITYKVRIEGEDFFAPTTIVSLEARASSKFEVVTIAHILF